MKEGRTLWGIKTNRFECNWWDVRNFEIINRSKNIAWYVFPAPKATTVVDSLVFIISGALDQFICITVDFSKPLQVNSEVLNILIFELIPSNNFQDVLQILGQHYYQRWILHKGNKGQNCQVAFTKVPFTKKDVTDEQTRLGIEEETAEKLILKY